MLNLRRDLFSRLVISAQKDRRINSLFKVSHVDSWKAPKLVSLDIHNTEGLEKEIVKTIPSSIMVNEKSETILKAPNPIIRLQKKERIEEKVDNILNDPALIEVQIELEFAEELLKKVRQADAHNPKIPLIEETILKLRELLNQKMYV
jgi:hypothetical protein